MILLEVPADTPAAKFGLRPTDVVRSLGGKPTDTLDAFESLYYGLAPGRGVELTIFRNQQEQKLAIHRGNEARSAK